MNFDIFCLDGTKGLSLQAGQVHRYNEFSNYRKRIFWYLWNQYETMIKREPTAKAFFSNVKRCTVLKVLCDLADISNEPNKTNDCWVANTTLIKGNERPKILIGGTL